MPQKATANNQRCAQSGLEAYFYRQDVNGIYFWHVRLTNLHNIINYDLIVDGQTKIADKECHIITIVHWRVTLKLRLAVPLNKITSCSPCTENYVL